MISAITGLPDLVLDKKNDVQIDIEFDKNRPKNIMKEINQEVKNELNINKVESREKKFNQTTIDELNKELNSFLEGNKLNAEFKFDKEFNQLVMKLIDNETKEVVRQVPAEFMLKIARLIASQIDGGALADAKV